MTGKKCRRWFMKEHCVKKINGQYEPWWGGWKKTSSGLKKKWVKLDRNQKGDLNRRVVGVRWELGCVEYSEADYNCGCCDADIYEGASPASNSHVSRMHPKLSHVRRMHPKLNRTLLFISLQSRLGGVANMSERFYSYFMTDTWEGFFIQGGFFLTRVPP